MHRKIKNDDVIFAVFLFIAFSAMAIFIFIPPYVNDETFYCTIPFRFINGDSIIQHEWHLSQFSSLFTYLPVSIWIALKNSTEGIVVFLRCVYFFIHTLTTVSIYRFFRMYGKWAILSSMMFFALVPYRIFAISYHSMLVIFLLLFTLSLLSVLKKESVVKYISAGVCYASCCICNPILCVLFAVYVIVFVFRTVITKKTVCEVMKSKSEESEDGVCNVFFSKKAIVCIFSGVMIMVCLSVGFFILTGGSFSSLIENLSNMFNSSEYKLVSLSFGEKLKEIIRCYNKLSFDIPFLLPALYIALLLDKKRTKASHRLIFLFAALVLSLMYAVGMFANFDHRTLFVTLPFAIFSTTCYILTDKKNKTLFYYMWLPAFIVSVFYLVAANTVLTAVGVVFQVNNIAGAFFVADLFKEMKQNGISMLKNGAHEKKTDSSFKKKMPVARWNYAIISIGLCVQFVCQAVCLSYDQFSDDEKYSVTNGPYAGIYMTEEEYNNYNASLNDMDIIKSECRNDTPVLLMSSQNWMYLYLNQPVATYTAWFEEDIDCEQLIAYYRSNTEKIPAYIYVDSSTDNSYSDSAIENKMNAISSMFDVTQEELNTGILLKVQGYKFSLTE